MEGEEELRTYRCRQCRASLFTENDIEQHQRGLGQQAFAWAKRATAQGPTCSSLFIDCSLEWLGDMAEQEGKLFCPKCHAKLGAYKWYGDQCSCGYVATERQTPSDCAPHADTATDTDTDTNTAAMFSAWCTPAIQVLQSRVDCVEKSTATAGLQVRMPWRPPTDVAAASQQAREDATADNNHHNTTTAVAVGGAGAEDDAV